ncbi:hypothetical protein MDAP_002005 [Mitosporidium daphniae]
MSSSVCVGGRYFCPLIFSRCFVSRISGALTASYSTSSSSSYKGFGAKRERRSEQPSRFEELSDDSKRTNNNTRRFGNNHAPRYDSSVHYSSKGFSNADHERMSAPFKRRTDMEYQSPGSETGKYQPRREMEYRGHREQRDGFNYPAKEYFKQRPFERRDENPDFHSRSNPAWKSNARVHLTRNREDQYTGGNFESNEKQRSGSFKRNYEKSGVGGSKFEHSGRHFSGYSKDESDIQAKGNFRSRNSSYSNEEAGDQRGGASQNHYGNQKYSGNGPKNQEYRKSGYAAQGVNESNNEDHYVRKNGMRAFNSEKAKYARERSLPDFDEQESSEEKHKKSWDAKPHHSFGKFNASAKALSGQIPKFEKTSNDYDKNAEPLYSLKKDKTAAKSEARRNGPQHAQAKLDNTAKEASIDNTSQDNEDNIDAELTNGENVRPEKTAETFHNESLHKASRMRVRNSRIVRERLAKKPKDRLKSLIDTNSENLHASGTCLKDQKSVPAALETACTPILFEGETCEAIQVNLQNLQDSSQNSPTFEIQSGCLDSPPSVSGDIPDQNASEAVENVVHAPQSTDFPQNSKITGE